MLCSWTRGLVLCIKSSSKGIGKSGRREKTGWHHFSCFRVERQDRQENCNNKKSQRGESRKQHNGSRGLFSRWGVSIYVKTLGANGKWLPTKIYIYGIMTGACVNSFFCGFPDFSSRTILVSSDAVRFFLKSSYAEEERIFFASAVFAITGISQCLFNSERSSEEDLLNPRIRIHGARNKSTNIHWSSTLISSMRFMSARLTLA